MIQSYAVCAKNGEMLAKWQMGWVYSLGERVSLPESIPIPLRHFPQPAFRLGRKHQIKLMMQCYKTRGKR